MFGWLKFLFPIEQDQNKRKRTPSSDEQGQNKRKRTKDVPTLPEDIKSLISSFTKNQKVQSIEMANKFLEKNNTSKILNGIFDKLTFSSNDPNDLDKIKPTTPLETLGITKKLESLDLINILKIKQLKSLSISDNPTPRNEIDKEGNALGMAESLQYLNLRNTSADFVPKGLQTNVTLTELKLFSAGLNEENAKKLANVMLLNDGIKIESLDIQNDDIKSAISLFGQLDLKILQLSSVGDASLYETEWIKFFEGIQLRGKLRELYVLGNKINDNIISSESIDWTEIDLYFFDASENEITPFAFKKIFSVSSEYVVLKEQSIPTSMLSFDNFEKSLANNSTMSWLDISENNYDSEVFAQIVRATRTNTCKLEYLVTHSNQITNLSEDKKDIEDILYLRLLDIQDNNVTCNFLPSVQEDYYPLRAHIYLNTLNVSGNSLGGKQCTRRLTAFLDQNKRLQVLVLSCNQFSPTECLQILDSIMNVRSLQTLKMEYMKEVVEEEVVEEEVVEEEVVEEVTGNSLYYTLRYNTTLKTLYLRGISFKSEQMKNLLCAISGSKTLKSLYLSASALNEEKEMKNLMNAEFCSLEELNLQGELSDDDSDDFQMKMKVPKYFLEALNKNSTFKKIGLSMVQFNKDTFTSFGNNIKLTNLDLSGNDFRSLHEPLLNMISMNNTLKRLDLHCTLLDDKFVYDLMDSLQEGHPSLQEFAFEKEEKSYFSSVKISNATETILSEAKDKLENNFSPDTINKFESFFNIKVREKLVTKHLIDSYF